MKKNVSFHGGTESLFRRLDRDDLKVLYKLVQERFEDHSLEEKELILWGDLRMMFDPDEQDEIWKNQESWKVLRWRLYENSGVHSVFLTDTPMEINMLVEKKYPLKKEILEKMINLKLQAEEESTMAFELIKFTRSQIEEKQRLGHINFKTMNKLAKGNLVRGLPSKLFENNQTCVACQKGKKHKASNRKSSNGNACTKACDDACKARMEIVPGKDYILLPFTDCLIHISRNVSKSSPEVGFKTLEMLNKEGYCKITGIEGGDFKESWGNDVVGAEADMNNLDAFMLVSPILTTRIHKDHPVKQIIGDLEFSTSNKKNDKEFGRTWFV
ncbi:ribonuclease H-like domain-containing protein [Tanacetum coccineum]